jgi:hypothetical protein
MKVQATAVDSEEGSEVQFLQRFLFPSLFRKTTVKARFGGGIPVIRATQEVDIGPQEQSKQR